METVAVWCVLGAGVLALLLVRAVRSWRALLRRLDAVSAQNAQILVALDYFTLPPEDAEHE